MDRCRRPYPSRPVPEPVVPANPEHDHRPVKTRPVARSFRTGVARPPEPEPPDRVAGSRTASTRTYCASRDHPRTNGYTGRPRLECRDRAGPRTISGRKYLRYATGSAASAVSQRSSWTAGRAALPAPNTAARRASQSPRRCTASALHEATTSDPTSTGAAKNACSPMVTENSRDPSTFSSTWTSGP